MYTISLLKVREPGERDWRRFEYPNTDEGKQDFIAKQAEAEKAGFEVEVALVMREEVTVS